MTEEEFLSQLSGSNSIQLAENLSVETVHELIRSARPEQLKAISKVFAKQKTKQLLRDIETLYSNIIEYLIDNLDKLEFRYDIDEEKALQMLKSDLQQVFEEYYLVVIYRALSEITTFKTPSSFDTESRFYKDVRSDLVRDVYTVLKFYLEIPPQLNELLLNFLGGDINE